MKERCLHKEHPPAGLGPFFIVELQRCSSFDEEGYQDLHPAYDVPNSLIGEFAHPYLEFAVLACVAIDFDPGRFEVPGRSVSLNEGVEVGGLIESS